MSSMSDEALGATKPATADANHASEEPVFIVGMPRTGSKMYRKLINSNTEFNISPEIFFLTPWWSRSDFMQVTSRAIRASRDDASLARVANMVFDGAYFGSYFRGIGGDRDALKVLLCASDRSDKGLFDALLKFDALRKGKLRTGAKFPVHIASADILFQWYPRARFIHINRHPVAIYVSQKRKHLENARGTLRRAFTVIKVLLATIVSYRCSYGFFRRHRHKANYLLCQYEDVVTDPERHIRRICAFLRVPFDVGMLAAPSKGSSHGHERAAGIHQKSRDAWRAQVRWIEKVLFRLTTPTRWNS